jgi:hypothetical protein
MENVNVGTEPIARHGLHSLHRRCAAIGNGLTCAAVVARGALAGAVQWFPLCELQLRRWGHW